MTMIKPKKAKLFRAITLAALILPIVVSFAMPLTTSARNDTFLEFDKVSYPHKAENEAEEIAHYSDYILPIIATQDWCLGSRVDYGTSSGENKAEQIFHVNRCAYLHASDYARLHHIIALNAALSSPDDNHLRYFNDGQVVVETGKSINPKNDTDETYLNSVFKNNTSLDIKKILPTADGKMSYSELSQLFIPGVSLKDEVAARIFGFQNTNNKSGYGGMFYNSLNSALRDCTENADGLVDPASDQSSNNRAILLNPGVAKILETTNNASADKKACLDKCERMFNPSTGSPETENPSTQATDPIECFNEKAKSKRTEWDSGIGMQPYQGMDPSFDPMIRISQLVTEDYQACVIRGGSQENCLNEIIKLENRSKESSTFGQVSLEIQTFKQNQNESVDQEWANTKAVWIIREIVGLFNSCLRMYDGHYTKDECIKSCEAEFPEVKGYDASNCATLVSTLTQVDHPQDSAYFIEKGKPASQWLPLTETEKNIMDYGKNLDHNIGGNEVTLFEDEVSSTCYFRGVKSFLCTFTNFLGTLSDSAFNIIESFVRFPAKILRSQTGAGEVNLYTAWQSFRDIANIVLVIMLLISIVSQITGWKISVLGVKNNLLRFLVAAVLVNLSFFICQIAVDVSNMVGGGVQGIFKNSERVLFEAMSLPTGKASTISTIVGEALGFIVIGGIVITTLIAVITNLVILLPVIVGALVTATMTLLMLLGIHIFTIILVLTSPIVFALAGTEATSKYTKQWWKMLVGILVIYPSISLAFSLGDFTYNIVSTINHVNRGGIIFDILALALLFLPLTLVPKILKDATTKLPLLGEKLSNLTDRGTKKARRALDNTKLVQSAKTNKALERIKDQTGRSRPNPLLHPLRAGKSRLNRPSRGRTGRKSRFSKAYGTAYDRLYSNQLARGAVTDDWMNDRMLDMYKYGNGDTTMERIRSYNDGNAFDADSIAADLLTVSDDGAGYFEEVLMALNKLREGGVDSSNIADLSEKIIDGYAKNSRFEVVALLKEVRDNTGGRYDLSLDDFNNNYGDAQLEQVINRELLSQSGQPRALDAMNKFAGADSQAKVNATLKKSYSTSTANQLGNARSSQIGVNSMQNLFTTNERYRSYVRSNRHSMSKKGQDFVDNLESGLTMGGGGGFAP